MTEWTCGLCGKHYFEPLKICRCRCTCGHWCRHGITKQRHSTTKTAIDMLKEQHEGKIDG